MEGWGFGYWHRTGAKGRSEEGVCIPFFASPCPLSPDLARNAMHVVIVEAHSFITGSGA